MAQESMETNGEHSEGFQKLIDYGINSQVAEELDKLYQSGMNLFHIFIIKYSTGTVLENI